MKVLTDRQREILRFIIRHVEANGFPPTLRTIRDEFGIGTVGGAAVHLTALERKGHIASATNTRASYSVVKDEEGREVRLMFVPLP